MKIKNVRTTFVQKDNRIVCILTYDLNFINELEENIYWSITDRTKLGNLKVVGKAKCNPVDIFDNVIGKRIALQRAHAKMFKHVAFLTSQIAKYIYNGIDQIEARYEKYVNAFLRDGYGKEVLTDKRK